MCLGTFLKRVSDPRGSAIVEAAFLFPLAALLLAGGLSLSLAILAETEADALRHREEARAALEPELIRTENILRGVWLHE